VSAANGWTGSSSSTSSYCCSSIAVCGDLPAASSYEAM
jgi:hypothetical protein